MTNILTLENGVLIDVKERLGNFASMIKTRERAEEIVALIAEQNPHLETRIAKF